MDVIGGDLPRPIRCTDSAHRNDHRMKDNQTTIGNADHADGSFTMPRTERLRTYLRRIFLSLPGVKPRTTKRNVLVVLGYLLLFGLLIALFEILSGAVVLGTLIPVRVLRSGWG